MPAGHIQYGFGQSVGWHERFAAEAVRSEFPAEAFQRFFPDRFRANHASDPTGYQTLKAVLKESDMRAFRKRWERFVLALRF